MIILIQDRKDNYHLSDYTPSNGNKYTLCNLVYCKSDIVNTLALDNSVPIICRTCHENYTAMYLDDLDYDPRIAHNQTNNNLTYQYQHTVSQMYSPDMVYWEAINRNWLKLNKYQRKTQRK